MDVKQHLKKKKKKEREKKKKTHISDLRSCVKVEVDVLSAPSPIVLMVSVDVKQHLKKDEEDTNIRSQELCESRGGRPELSVPNSLYGLCGRKAAFEEGRGRHKHQISGAV